jgi:hypothetical protein
MRIITTDLYESSFLDCSGIELAEVWLDQGRLQKTVVFAFDGNYQLEELQKSYRTGNAIVNLADYRHSLNRLRDMMFELLKNQNNEQKTRRDCYNGKLQPTPHH